MKKEQYQIGIDWAYKPKLWIKFLVWLGIKKRDWDYSCMVIGYYDKKGIFYIKDIKTF